MTAAPDIAKYLQDNLTPPGTFIIGTNIFTSQMPSDPSKAICVYQTSGRKPDPVETTEYPGIQIIVRDTVAADAEALADQIFQLLAGAINLTINTRAYHWIEAQGSPINIGQDDLLRVAFTISFVVMKDMD